MKLTRIMFLALAFALPTSWTVAHAEDAPAAGETAKKEKKAKKSKEAAPAEGAAAEKAPEKK